MKESTFKSVIPNPQQAADIMSLIEAGLMFGRAVTKVIPDGPQKAKVVDKFREVMMWANAAVVRHPDGTPKDGAEVHDKAAE